jgi:hypothetical protein
VVLAGADEEPTVDVWGRGGHPAMVAVPAAPVTGSPGPVRSGAARSRCIQPPWAGFSAPRTLRRTHETPPRGCGHQLRRSTGQVSRTSSPSATTIRSW